MLSNGISKTHHAQILSCFGQGAGAWLTIQLIFPRFRLTSLVFSTTFQIRLGLPHPSIASILQCMCTHPIDPMGIHLLCCAHVNKRTWTHDVFATPLLSLHGMLTSMWSENNYMRFLQTCWILLVNESTFVLTKDDICTLVDVVIVDPTWTNLFPWSHTTQGFVASNVAQAKERSYHNRHPIDQFLPLVVEIFGCLHK
jgi:hypothetical protein